MDNVWIREMTIAQMHAFFKEFIYDPATFTDGPALTPYVYDKKIVDAYYEKHKAQGKLHFAILLENKVIGDLYLKHMDCFATTLLSHHLLPHMALTSKMVHNASAKMAFQPSAERHLIDLHISTNYVETASPASPKIQSYSK